jgi:outer membrane receptor for ferrienterochelin and colicin
MSRVSEHLARLLARLLALAFPLIFLNGERITEERMRQIPKESIASVEVIKGDSAIAKYGKDAVDGVILIVTK